VAYSLSGWGYRLEMLVSYRMCPVAALTSDERAHLLRVLHMLYMRIGQRSHERVQVCLTSRGVHFIQVCINGSFSFF
jgi:hypothetical protein